MTKEELTALGLDEDQIKEVFKLNGIAVENAKGDLATKETELASAKEQLKTANTEIESYKSMDIEAIKAAANEYKTKYEEAKTKAEQDIADLQFENELEGAIRDSKAKNVKAVKALLDIESLKGSNNRLEDIKRALEQTKTDNDFLFGDSTPIVTGRPPNNTGGTPPGVRNPFSKEHFNLTEQGRILTDDPVLAKQLQASAR